MRDWLRKATILTPRLSLGVHPCCCADGGLGTRYSIVPGPPVVSPDCPEKEVCIDELIRDTLTLTVEGFGVGNIFSANCDCTSLNGNYLMERSAVPCGWRWDNDEGEPDACLACDNDPPTEHYWFQVAQLALPTSSTSWEYRLFIQYGDCRSTNLVQIFLKRDSDNLPDDDDDCVNNITGVYDQITHSTPYPGWINGVCDVASDLSDLTFTIS